MDLSIIIVNWNTKDLLLRCLNAIYQTVRAVEMEVIVVDNGSKDGSVAAAVERFPKARFIQNQMNLGFARANNQALSVAAGRYLLLLNPDTVVRDRAIENLLSFMEADPKVGVAGGQLINPDGSKQNSIANFPTLATELLNKSLLRWLFPGRFPGKERVYGEPIEVESVIGACMMVRGKTVEEVGPLDEGYFLFLEETDWCYRMKKAGWKVYHVPAAQVYHFQGKSAETDIKGAKIEYYRSRYRFFQKHRGLFQRALLLLGLMGKLGVESSLMLIVCVVTLFKVQRWKRRLSIYGHLVSWHLRLCPKEMGLRTTEK
jgi:GT2 family glycosyltransferase